MAQHRELVAQNHRIGKLYHMVPVLIKAMRMQCIGRVICLLQD